MNPFYTSKFYIIFIIRKSNLSSSALVSGKEEEQHRLTPHKFNCAHGLVKLTNGIIASVDTSGANYQIKLENMGEYLNL